MRFAKIRADRVEVGMRMPTPMHVVPPRLREVVSTRQTPDVPNAVTIVFAGGNEFHAPRDYIVRVADDSGLLQLKEDVEVYGPYVTTTTFNADRAGSIHFANLRQVGHIVKADLLIRRDDQTLVRLDSVELGHLEDMARTLVERVRNDPNAMRYHSKLRGGCGQFHRVGGCGQPHQPTGCIDEQGCAEDGPCGRCR